MANEGIRAAIEELRSKIEEKSQEIIDTKKAINLLLSTIQEPPEFTDLEQNLSRRGIQIRPDQFFRKSITAAAYEFLKAKGSAATVSEIIDALKRGSCDLGSSPLRNVKISLSKNSKTFATVSEDVFGLWDFYGGSPRAKKESEAPQDDTAESSEDYVPKVGDYVQWKPNGILQFREPKRITSFSEDGAFAFVDGGNTGVPISELTLQEKPAPMKDSVKQKSRLAADQPVKKEAAS